MKHLITLFFLGSLLISDTYLEGEILYFQKGCHGCHGATAQGLHQFPKLANQKEKDLIRKFNAYRADKIKTPQASIMTGYAKALTQVEMNTIIYYLVNYKDTSNDERYDDSYDNWGDGGS